MGDRRRGRHELAAALGPALPSKHLPLLHVPASQLCRGEKCKASGLNVHAASKLYLIMWARELSARLRNKKAVDIFCVHPGERLHSDCSRGWG